MRLLLFIMILLLLAAPAAKAGMLLEAGNLLSGGSWGQEWTASSDTMLYDTVVVRIFSGTTFERLQTSDPGWSYLGQGTLDGYQIAILATDNPTQTVSFDTWFNGDPADASLDFLAFGLAKSGGHEGSGKNGHWGDEQHHQYKWDDHGGFHHHDGDNKDWNQEPPDKDECKHGLVPVPPAILLGAIGLGLVGWVKRRMM